VGLTELAVLEERTRLPRPRSVVPLTQLIAACPVMLESAGEYLLRGPPDDRSESILKGNNGHD
jgi:hypothetical protein